LHGALERHELQILYQPQLDASSGRLVGAEALLRWHHPELGDISPKEFIPIAETTSDILPIGEWVLQQAIRQLKHWLGLGLPLERVAVNLSAIQFRQSDLAERISNLLGEVGLSGDRLEIELTESVMLQNPEMAIRVMSGFQESGVQLSIDDFGTGYSSLSYLKRLRVNRLKIDASFIRDLATSSDDQSIVSAIINLARGLKLRTIAEGVETPAQLQFLQQSGCDEIQGFLFARPLTPEAFVAFAQERDCKLPQAPISRADV
jgi:EAL domain-containing protein (putative c-di-GMP-specific phosphodiesterase class I)